MPLVVGMATSNGFTAFASALPSQLVLDSIGQHPDKENIFLITGRSYDLNPIGLFATSLQENDWCTSAVMKTVKADGGDKLYFEISIKAVGLKD